MQWKNNSYFTAQIRKLSKPSLFQTPLFLKSIWPMDSHHTFLGTSETMEGTIVYGNGVKQPCE